MHVLLGIAAVAALVGFAFGEIAARMFVGAVLSLGAALVLFVIFVSIVDTNRQSTSSYVIKVQQ